MSQDKFTALCWIWIGIALLLFPILLKVTQPYGKHSNKNWGPMLNNKLGWMLMELPALIVFGFFLNSLNNGLNSLIIIAALLWGLHYIHRALIFPFLLNTKGKKMPVIIVLFAIFFNAINGFLNGYWLSHFAMVNQGVWFNMSLALGVLIFVLGFAINKYHDWLLIKLRKTSEQGYKIPYGGLFKYVSCPNFLGEVITWVGFLIVCWSLPALSFLIWTLVNLLPRALDHHKWYRTNFKDYPDNRKAIFPYIL